MFGIYRTILAGFVVLDHFAGARPLGPYAVYSFFCLSGFLMTLLMRETYARRPLDFAINRFLRVYPMYWAVAAATMLFILLRPLPDMIGGHNSMGIPVDAGPLLKQALYLVRETDDLRLVPVAWAVTNELIFYVLIGAGISATVTKSALWLTASVAVLGCEFARGYSVEDVYFSPLTASFAFSLGSSLYHVNKLAGAATLAPVIVAALVLCSAGQSVMLNAGAGGHVQSTIPVLLNCVSAGAIVVLLYNMPASKTLLRWDARIGTLSYPIYLCHFLAALIVKSTPPYLDIWIAHTLVTLALSVTLVWFVDLPVQALRGWIRVSRPSAAPTAYPSAAQV